MASFPCHLSTMTDRREKPADKPKGTIRPTPDGIEIDLRDPLVAGVLAWLWPGAGHLYQRRYAKGMLFMVCILGTFFFGLVLGKARSSTLRSFAIPLRPIPGFKASSAAGRSPCNSAWDCRQCQPSRNRSFPRKMLHPSSTASWLRRSIGRS